MLFGAGVPVLQLEDKADNLNDRLVMIVRDFLVDLNRVEQRTGQGRVRHDRYIILIRTSRMRKATSSTPLATTTGAPMLSESYFNATE